MEYDILVADFHDDLVVLVRKAISEGWTPLGGVAISPRTSNEPYQHYAQSMTRNVMKWTYSSQIVPLDEGRLITVESN